MALVASLLGIQTFNTTSGSHTVTATPAVGDLIIIGVANTGSSSSIDPSDDKGGTYALINSAVKATSADAMRFYVREQLIASASSTVFTHAPGTTTGGGLAVFKVTGATLAGLSAIRQSAKQDNQASGTPAPVFGAAPLTGNAIIGMLFNATNAAAMTPRTSFTEAFDIGWATPTTGVEAMYRSSGETSTTQTWGSSSASAFCSIVVEIWDQSAPTSALNTPADAATGVSLTPTLNFTGTDANSDSVEYEVQVDTVNTFDSATSTSGTAGESDDFNDNSIDGAKWTGAFGTVTETGGQMVFTCASNSTAYSGIDGASNFDLTGKEYSVELVSAGNQTIASLEVGPIQLLKDSTNGLSFYINGGNIQALRKVAGVNAFGGSMTYNSTTHKYLRIREASGRIYWEYSSDRKTWTQLYAFTSQFAVTALHSENYAGKFAVDVNATSMILDNVNLRKVPLLDKLSTVDTGFTAGHPFTSGSAKDFTVQAGDTLTTAITYYWRVRAIDPTGSNSWGAWATTRSFVTGNVAWVKNLSDTMTLADVASKKPAKNLTDSMAMADANSEKPTVNKTDTVSIADAQIKTIVLNKSDSVILADAFSRLVAYLRSLTDTVVLADVIKKTSGKPIADTVTISDLFNSAIGKVIALSDSLSLSDTAAKSLVKTISDTLSLADSLSKVFKLNKAETIALVDSITKVLGKSLSDNATISDVMIKTVGKSLTDIVTAADALAKVIGMNRADTQTLTDTLIRVSVVNKNDTLIILDVLKKSAAINPHDTMLLIDALSKSTTKPLSDTLILSDVLARSAVKPISDSVEISDAAEKKPVKNLNDSMQVSDSLSQRVVKLLTDSISIIDDLIRSTGEGGGRIYRSMIEKTKRIRSMFSSKTAITKKKDDEFENHPDTYKKKLY